MKIDELRTKPHWSYTALNTYLNVCQLQYFFRYIEQAEAEQISACLLFGKAFHAALSQQAEVANKGSNLSVENLGDMFDEYSTRNAIMRPKRGKIFQLPEISCEKAV